MYSHTKLETKEIDLRPLLNLKFDNYHSKYEMLFP